MMIIFLRPRGLNQILDGAVFLSRLFHESPRRTKDILMVHIFRERISFVGQFSANCFPDEIEVTRFLQVGLKFIYEINKLSRSEGSDTRRVRYGGKSEFGWFICRSLESPSTVAEFCA